MLAKVKNANANKYILRTTGLLEFEFSLGVWRSIFPISTNFIRSQYNQCLGPMIGKVKTKISVHISPKFFNVNDFISKACNLITIDIGFAVIQMVQYLCLTDS